MSDEATSALAVVIMAKEPVAGRTKTRLSPPWSPADSARLYEALLGDTIALVSGVRGARLALAVTPASAVDRWRPTLPGDAVLLPVDGATVGDCLREAFHQLFDAGFASVIAINSDGPTLPAARVEQAAAWLAHTDVILGPSDDGGYYLIGLRRPQPDLFRDIAWSTADVMAQTLERVAALKSSVAVLAPWYDIDTAADVERLRAEVAGLPAGVLCCTRQFFATAAGVTAAERDTNAPDAQRLV
jgi:rSAM/selenodomain-associated transferase 1